MRFRLRERKKERKKKQKKKKLVRCKTCLLVKSRSISIKSPAERFYTSYDLNCKSNEDKVFTLAQIFRGIEGIVNQSRVKSELFVELFKLLHLNSTNFYAQKST